MSSSRVVSASVAVRKTQRLVAEVLVAPNASVPCKSLLRLKARTCDAGRIALYQPPVGSGEIFPALRLLEQFQRPEELPFFNSKYARISMAFFMSIRFLLAI